MAKKRFRIKDAQGNVVPYDVAAEDVTLSDGRSVETGKASVLNNAGFLDPAHFPKLMLYNVTPFTSEPDYSAIPVGSVYLDTREVAPYKRLFYKKNIDGNTQTIDLGAPQDGVVYCHQSTGILYRWVPSSQGNDGSFSQVGGDGDLKDFSGHIKQSVAAAQVLRFISNPVAADMVDGDIYYSLGGLQYVSNGSITPLGAPSKYLTYFCVEDNKFYKWTGSAFQEIEMPAGDDGAPGITPHIDQTTGNWFVGDTDTGVHAQGEKGNTVVLDPNEVESFEIVNNLVDGGEGDALSAEQGKTLGDAVFAVPTYDLKSEIDAASLIAYYINGSTGKWSGSSNYKSIIINVQQYRGMRVRFKCLQFSSTGYYFCRYAFLTNNNYSAGRNVEFCSGEDLINNQGENATQYVDDYIPNDCNYLYVYAFSNDNIDAEKDVTPREATLYSNVPTNRIEVLEDLTDGVDEIKEDWFAVSGEPQPYSMTADEVGERQSIGTNGFLYLGTTNAPAVMCAPKCQVSGTSTIANYTPSPTECYKVSDLPNKSLTIKFNQQAGYSWSVAVVLYDTGCNFIERVAYEPVTSSDNWQVTFDLSSYTTAKYLKLLFVYRAASGGNGDAIGTYSIADGWCEFGIQLPARLSMPDRVSALEEAVGDLKGAGVSKFRICSWNVGHFALGTSYKTTIDTQEEYEEMRTKWRTKLNEMSPDVLVMCEYSTIFADLATDVEAKNAIFCQYAYRAIGSHPSATSYMQTAQYSNIPISNTSEVVYAQTVQAGRYYQVSDLVLGGVTAKLVITHLDFGNDNNQGDAYRAAQMQALITAFANEPYVIICGDFNNKLTSEWDVFTQAGYTMANHGYMDDISTYPAGAATKAFDNIIVKGFAVSKIEIVDDATLTDHAAIMCDLTLL